ncbi:hypothetical protein ACP0HM_30690 [Escherichia coli]
MPPQPVWRSAEKPEEEIQTLLSVWFYRHLFFPENALGSETTASVFGRELHTYVITDAIRDEKVLKFKVDYNDVRPQFKSLETETDEKN